MKQVSHWLYWTAYFLTYIIPKVLSFYFVELSGIESKIRVISIDNESVEFSAFKDRYTIVMFVLA